jgi:uncharacterized protein (TIGR03435 family)
MRAFALGLFACATILAQNFEVASVRSSGPLPAGSRERPAGFISGGPGTNDPERISYERVLFRQLLMAAYNVQRDQLKGPDWATTDDIGSDVRFDISAKVPPGTTKEQVSRMLQNLLAERFQLSLHHETAQFSDFSLITQKGGAKFEEATRPPENSERFTPKGGGQIQLTVEKHGFPQLFPGRNMGGRLDGGVVRMRFRDYPIYDLVQQLSMGLSVHLIDRTGLTGRCDFTLEIGLPGNGFPVGMYLITALNPGQPAPLNKNPPSPDQQDAVPVISAAMEKQLGLKLEPTKITIDMLVIDHLEKTPTGN